MRYSVRKYRYRTWRDVTVDIINLHSNVQSNLYRSAIILNLATVDLHYTQQNIPYKYNLTSKILKNIQKVLTFNNEKINVRFSLLNMFVINVHPDLSLLINITILYYIKFTFSFKSTMYLVINILCIDTVIINI